MVEIKAHDPIAEIRETLRSFVESRDVFRIASANGGTQAPCLGVSVFQFPNREHQKLNLHLAVKI